MRLRRELKETPVEDGGGRTDATLLLPGGSSAESSTRADRVIPGPGSDRRSGTSRAVWPWWALLATGVAFVVRGALG